MTKSKFTFQIEIVDTPNCPEATRFAPEFCRDTWARTIFDDLVRDAIHSNVLNIARFAVNSSKSKEDKELYLRQKEWSEGKIAAYENLYAKIICVKEEPVKENN